MSGQAYTTHVAQAIDVKYLRQLADRPGMNVPWTTTELGLLAQYAPSTFKRIAEAHPEFGSEVIDIDDPLAFQAGSEVVGKGGTIDTALVHTRRTANSVGSKIHNANRIISIYEALGFQHPDHISIVDGMSSLDEVLLYAKDAFTALLRSAPAGPAVETMRKEADILPRELAQFSFVDDLRRRLGDDIAVALFGSATTSPDFDDYDIFVVVPDGTIGAMYQTGDLVGARLANPFDGKSIGINMIEQSQFTKYVRWQHNPLSLLESCRVLYGSLDFPVVSEEENREHGIAHMMLRVKSLRSAAIWTAHDGALAGKPPLFAYFQKTLRFLAEEVLNSEEGHRVRSKDELSAFLRKLGWEELQYVPNNTALVEATQLATVASSRLLDRFFRGKQFDQEVLH